MRACKRSLFVVVGGRVWGGLASLWRALVAWHGVFFLTDGEIGVEIGVLSVSSLFFDAGGSVSGFMCVCTHTHTHCTWDTRM